MYPRWRPAAGLACAALAVSGAADAAHAGTASGRPAQFRAAAGEHNALTVDAGPDGAVRFSDAGAPVAAALPWCSPFPLGQALCDPDGDPRVTDGGGVSVELADRDDAAIIRWIPGTDTRPGAIRVLAGAGNDRVENVAFGLIRFDGGDGNDTLVTGPHAGAYFLGGTGADLMVSSHGCCALTSYSDHDGAGVTVSLDAAANDGLPEEGDDVRTSGVIGSPGPDVITGDAGSNSLTGSGGADVLSGGGGSDSINARLQDTPADTDTVTCGAGDDVVVANENDTVAVDCERIRVGLSGPELILDTRAARAGDRGIVKLTYRMAFPNPDNALASRSRLRLVDTKGRAASSTARFALGGDVSIARVRVKLSRATRRRLAHARTGALALIAQRVSHSAGSTASGYEQFNTPLTIRRDSKR